MKSVTAQERIVLHLFQALRMRLRVFCGRITRRRLAFFASFGALQRDDLNFTLLCHYRLSNRLKVRGMIGHNITRAQTEASSYQSAKISAILRFVSCKYMKLLNFLFLMGAVKALR